MSYFKAGTGLISGTESGQRVTKDNVDQLPPGSVVRIGDGSRLIHLHDKLWLWCCDNAWTYDKIEKLRWRLDANSVACHIPVNYSQEAGPAKTDWYKPMEDARRYPLELTKDLHICLWSETGTHKWTIGYFVKDKEGYDFKFIGDRPFDPRVNWEHFRELILQGQKMADAGFVEEQ